MKNSFKLNILIILLLFASSASGFEIHQVGSKVSADEHKFGQWIPKDILVYVGVNDENKDYIIIKSKNSPSYPMPGETSFLIQLNEKNVSDLSSALTKALEWSKLAKDNKKDVQKKITCFGDCDDSNSYISKSKMNFIFFSSQGGKQRNLVLEINDYYRTSLTSSDYLDEGQVKLFLENVTITKKKLLEVKQKNQKDDNLFK